MACARRMEGILFVEDRPGLERDVQERVVPALDEQIREDRAASDGGDLLGGGVTG